MTFRVHDALLRCQAWLQFKSRLQNILADLTTNTFNIIMIFRKFYIVEQTSCGGQLHKNVTFRCDLIIIVGNFYFEINTNTKMFNNLRKF